MEAFHWSITKLPAGSLPRNLDQFWFHSFYNTAYKTYAAMHPSVLDVTWRYERTYWTFCFSSVTVTIIINSLLLSLSILSHYHRHKDSVSSTIITNTVTTAIILKLCTTTAAAAQWSQGWSLTQVQFPLPTRLTDGPRKYSCVTMLSVHNHVRSYSKHLPSAVTC